MKKKKNTNNTEGQGGTIPSAPYTAKGLFVPFFFFLFLFSTSCKRTIRVSTYWKAASPSTPTPPSTLAFPFFFFLVVVVAYSFDLASSFFSTHFFRESMRDFTTLGSNKVLVSPRSSSFCIAIFRSIRRTSFPERVLGSPPGAG